MKCLKCGKKLNGLNCDYCGYVIDEDSVIIPFEMHKNKVTRITNYILEQYEYEEEEESGEDLTDAFDEIEQLPQSSIPEKNNDIFNANEIVMRIEKELEFKVRKTEALNDLKKYRMDIDYGKTEKKEFEKRKQEGYKKINYAYSEKEIDKILKDTKRDIDLIHTSKEREFSGVMGLVLGGALVSLIRVCFTLINANYREKYYSIDFFNNLKGTPLIILNFVVGIIFIVLLFYTTYIAHEIKTSRGSFYSNIIILFILNIWMSLKYINIVYILFGLCFIALMFVYPFFSLKKRFFFIFVILGAVCLGIVSCLPWIIHNNRSVDKVDNLNELTSKTEESLAELDQMYLDKLAEKRSEIEPYANLINCENSITALTLEGKIIFTPLLGYVKPKNLASTEDVEKMKKSMYAKQSAVNGWTNIKFYDANDNIIAAVDEYGNAKIATHFEGFDLSDWKNVVDIDVGTYHVVGLLEDGTVKVSETMEESGEVFQTGVETWTDIVDIDVFDNLTVGLKNDGTVVTNANNWSGTQIDTYHWKNVTKIYAASENLIYGIQSNGHVLATGENKNGECDVETWTDVVELSYGYSSLLGLREDGTVISTGKKSNVEDLTDIIAIYSSYGKSIGLKQDGTIVYTLMDYDEKCKDEEWTDIVSISMNGLCAVGLKSNGSVVLWKQKRSVDDGVYNVVREWQLFD